MWSAAVYRRFPRLDIYWMRTRAFEHHEGAGSRPDRVVDSTRETGGRGRRAVCSSDLRQIGLAIHSYAEEYDGAIPCGPTAPPFTSPASFYPSTGTPTRLIGLQGGAPVGLGLLLSQHLSDQPPGLESFNVKPRTYHRQRFVNVLHSDGHVLSRRNTDGRFTVNLVTYGEMRGVFSRILEVLESADQ